MKRLLLLSNGHGEDLSGALLGRQLQRLGAQVEALPLVGHGHAYRQAGIPVLGHTREYSTGGLGYTSLAGRLTELRQGQLLYLLGRLARLPRSRHDLIVVVGDVLPLLGAWLSGRPSVVYLVAYSSHYEGRLRLPWPCGWLLRRRRNLLVWSRDALTASDLSEQLGRPVEFLGNPFLDPVAAAPGAIVGAAGQTMGLLPGSRLPEALRNLALMLGVLERLPAALAQPGRLALQAALVEDLSCDDLERIAAPLGWQLSAGHGHSDGDAAHVLVRGPLRLQLHWRRFAAVLHGSDLLLSMTGTAAEQAVGLGKPVLQLEGEGPQFTPGFAEAQRRLLGPGVLCAPPGPEHLAASAALAASLLQRLAAAETGARWRQELAQLGRQRIGSPGGTVRQAAAIMESLSSPSGR